jgi:hypothetical protein
MLDQLFIENIWFGIAAWVLLYCSDYALTIVSASQYGAGANKHVVFKSLELTPYFQKDVAQLRWISPRFLFALFLSSAALWLVWFLMSYVTTPAWRWNIYRVLLGLHFLRKCKNYNLGAELSAPHIGTIHNSVDIDTF